MEYTDWPQAQELLSRLRANARSIANGCAASLATHTDDDALVIGMVTTADSITADLATLQALLPAVVP